MVEKKIVHFADMLCCSEAERVAIPPLSEKDDTLTVDDAYAIQLYNVERVVEQGYSISGKKIGLTSPGIQRQLGVSEPDYGHLFESMHCPDGNIPTDALIAPKIEGEVAFVLKSDLSGGQVTVGDVERATDYVVAAFEIVDSRVADWKIKLVDTISDNASSGRYVLGGKQVKLSDIDLPAVGMKLYKNGDMAAEGTGAAVLGNPCAAVAWLANRLWGYGVTLKAGEVILSGAFSAAPVAAKGDVFAASFTGLGEVRAAFV